MAGIPIGAGIGAFLGGFDDRSQKMAQLALRQLAVREGQQKLKEAQQAQEALALAYPGISDFLDRARAPQGQPPLPGQSSAPGQIPQFPQAGGPPMGGGGPQSQPTRYRMPAAAPAPLGGEMQPGTNGSWSPLARYAQGNAAVGGASPVDYLDPEFTRRTAAAVQAMPPELQSRFSVISGFRSPERQAQVNPAVTNSRHSQGRAMDIGNDPEVEAWITRHPEYGVGFPLANDPKERNHLEMTGGAARSTPARGGYLGHDAPRPIQMEAGQTAQRAAGSLSQQALGSVSLPQLVQSIDRANPGADPIVKMMALERAQKLLSPLDQRQWEAFKTEHHDAFEREMTEHKERFQAYEHEKERAFTSGESEKSRTFQREQQERGFRHQDETGGTIVQAEGPEGQAELGRIGKGGQYQPIQTPEGIKNVRPFTGAGAGHWETFTDSEGKVYDRNNSTGEVRSSNLPSGTRKVGTGAGTSINQEAVDFTAKQIANYDMPMPPGGRSTTFNQAVLAKVKQFNPNYDQTKYNAKNRGLIAFTTGRQSDSVRSFSVAIDHLETMREAADALENGDIQKLNQIRQYVSKEFGYAAPVDFDFAKSIVGAEVSKAIIGGVGALTDREELRNAFSTANSPAQLAAVADRAKKLIAGQLGGYRRQAGAAGMSEQDFDKALSEKAKKELYGLTSGAPPAQDAAPGASEGYRPSATGPDGKKIHWDGQNWIDDEGKVVGQ